MEALLKKKGHTVVPFDKGADAYIINTCTVTSTADKKSRNAVEEPGGFARAIVAVRGCFSQASPEDACWALTSSTAKATEQALSKNLTNFSARASG